MVDLVQVEYLKATGRLRNEVRKLHRIAAGQRKAARTFAACGESAQCFSASWAAARYDIRAFELQMAARKTANGGSPSGRKSLNSTEGKKA